VNGQQGSPVCSLHLGTFARVNLLTCQLFSQIMSSIYLHIPFCKQACHYCDFHFSTLQKTYQPVMDAMMQEISLRADYLESKKISSIYFGGGTPSLLKEKDLRGFIDKIQQTFDVAADAEITLESNPDDLSAANLKLFKSASINRLSIGTQSFFDAELKLMNRSHNAEEAKSSIMRAQDAGFENLTIDLIFGMPGGDEKTWRKNVETAIALQIPHLSAYSLTVEPKTALAKMVQSGEIVLPSESIVLDQYNLLCALTKEANFAHYELSNYGKPGFESRHNTSYWNGTPYLGIGPSAHSFNDQTRQWNTANNTKYSTYLNAKKDWWESEELDEKERFNEFVMTGLRTAKGISLNVIDERFGNQRVDQLVQDAQAKLECAKLILEDDVLKIPEKHWMLSDAIIAELFWV